MGVLKIRIFGDPVLEEKANKISSIDGDLFKLIKDMEETMRASEGIGLAAIQVGILKKLFIYDIGEGLNVCINPEIVLEEGEETEEEGCLSVPGVKVPIKRFKKVKVRAMDAKGNEIEITGEDLLARVFQHEIDHLNGILCINRTDKKYRRKAIRDFNNFALSEESKR
ncbi:MAG: peptide deformylase [Actinobacteria bacterium]|nr:peptide deformylase [Actinomycetota bacterium]